MTDAHPGKEELPSPPRLPRPMPEPAQAGWWVSPGALDPRVVRYHDGADWTDFVCRLGLRGPGEVEASPLPAPDERDAEEAAADSDPEIAALPKPGRFAWVLDPDRPKAGWWSDPQARKSNLAAMRYYDGERWTEFVCDLGLRGPGPISRRPLQPKG